MKKNKIYFMMGVLFFSMLAILCMNYMQSKEKKLDINADVEKYLKELCLSECKIIKCGDYSYDYKLPEIYIEESQVDEYIGNILETYVEYDVVEDRNVVRAGDFVSVDYSIYMEDVLLDNQRDVILKVGSGFFDEEFERIIIGNNVNNEYSIKTNGLSNIVSKEYHNKELTIMWIVKEILICNEQNLTDEFTKEKLGYNSVIEYKEYVKDKLEDEERNLLIDKNMQELLDKTISSSIFRIDEEQALEYATGYVKTYEELANINGLSLEKYIEDVLKVSEDTFYNSCYDEAEREIKKILIIGYIAQNKGVDLLSDDIAKYCETMNLSYDGMSREEKIL